MHGLVLLDGAGRVLRSAILWNDTRAVAERAELEALNDVRWLVGHTGNRALTGFTAPSLLWVQRNEPHVWRQIRYVLLPKDYVRLQLCGGLRRAEALTDVSDASGTLLFDVARRRWSGAVLEALDLNPTWLPAVVESSERAGTTLAGTLVAAGAGDQAAAALGLGLTPDGPFGIALGTSGVVTRVTRDPQLLDADGRLQMMCAARGGVWQTIGVTLSAAGSLAWWAPICGVPQSGVAALMDEAMAAPAGCDGLTFLPYLSGERAPHMDASARGAFVGLSAHHDRAAMTRAVIEGVAFSLADVLDLFGADSAEAVARVTGGAARNDFVLTVLAAVLGLRLERPVVDEGPAYGAALLAAVAADALEERDLADSFFAVDAVVEPAPALRAFYDDARVGFRRLYPALAQRGSVASEIA
jgi:xylulokinase